MMKGESFVLSGGFEGSSSESRGRLDGFGRMVDLMPPAREVKNCASKCQDPKSWQKQIKLDQVIWGDRFRETSRFPCTSSEQSGKVLLPNAEGILAT